MVIFALAFTFRFAALPSSPAGGWPELLCEIVTAGMCQPRHPATGYLAFFTLVLYVMALALLAPRARHVSDCPLTEAASGLEHPGEVESIRGSGQR